MLRFNYANKLVSISEDNKASFYTDFAYRRMTADEMKKLEDTTEIAIKKLSIDNYKKFLDIIQKETSSRTEKVYYVFYTNGEYLIVVREMNKVPYAKVLYKPENDQIKILMEKMLELKDGKSRVIIGNNKNNFNFLTANPILKTMFVHADLQARGEVIYAHRTMLKRSGKIRKYIAPHPEIIAPLQELNTILQKIYDKKNIDFQVAYKRGKSIVDNAKIHVNNQYLYNIDLKDFFPSCKRELVKRYINLFFKNSANAENMEKMFLDIILENDALFIGSPISGTIANAIISKPVLYLKNIADKFNMGFSVYADDMSFSSDKFITEEFINNIFSVAFTRYGMDNFFNLNKEKSHGMSKNRRRITGVSINEKNEATVSRKYYRNLRVKLHKLSIGETTINLQKLRGNLAFATMVDKSGKINNLIKKFEPTISEFKLISKERLDELKANGVI